MKQRTMWMALVTCVCLCATALTLDAARWVRLGQQAVNDKLDHDTVVVGRPEADFTAIKIQVRRAAVDFHRIVVHFANGQQQEVDVRSTIPAGGESRTIDLSGRDRVIQKVDFWYDAKTTRGRTATVVLLGLR